MNRIWKVTTVILAIALITLVIMNSVMVNEDEEHYKKELMKYVVSANDIVTIILLSDVEEADYERLYCSLFERFDRISMFIYQSNNYLGFDFHTRVFKSISSDLHKHLDDGDITDEELEYVKSLYDAFNIFIRDIRSKNIIHEESFDVNLDLSVKDIHSHVKALEYEFE